QAPPQAELFQAETAVKEEQQQLLLPLIAAEAEVQEAILVMEALAEMLLTETALMGQAAVAEGEVQAALQMWMVKVEELA
ncbi:MAG: hypothetical protein AAB112_02080, partial [Thermodesulfobacteriota bacterium]